MSSPGFTPEGMTQEQCDALHFKKNRPPLPAINGIEIEFPPYQFQRYPCAMYHATDPKSPALIHDEDEERNYRSRGWADSPAEAEAISKQREADRAVDAAVRAYDDRRLSDKAKAEVAALEQQTNDFVTDVPAPKKSARGRTHPAAATAEE